MDILFPIIGRLEIQLQEELNNKITPSITGPQDRLICYIHSSGGEANIASDLVSSISRLPIKTFVYAGPMVYSAGAIIFSAFEERFAFKDSKFLIHECIPPKGMERTEIYEQYDFQVWNFMSERMKISFEDLRIVAKKGERMTSEQALEIGLVHEIINASWREGYKKYIPI